MAIKLKGGKTNGIAVMKKSLKKGVSGDRYLQRVKANSTLTVRLLEEPDTWVKFYEYFDEEVQMFLPQAEGAKLTAKQKPVMRYIVNALDIEEAKVIPLVLAKSAVQQLVKYYEKFATIKDRDYEITRSSTGFDTEYDVDRLDPVQMKLSQYKLLDLEELLISQLTIARSRREGYESEYDDDDDSNEGDEITEEDLKAMELSELRELAKEYRLTSKGKDKETLINDLLEAADAEEDGY